MNSTIKERILKSLLISPKTTGELAIELGYIDKNGYGRYNVIKPDLNTLESYRFIHRTKSKIKKPGAPPTIYDINYDKAVLKKILKKYPHLITEFQKNDIILTLLSNWFETAPDPYKKEFTNALKLKLQLSPSLFKQIIKSDFKTLIKRFVSIYEISEQGQKRIKIEKFIDEMDSKFGIDRHKIEQSEFFNSGSSWDEKINADLTQEVSNVVFEACVYLDILNGCVSQTAIEYVSKINKGRVETDYEYISELKKGYYFLGRKITN